MLNRKMKPIAAAVGAAFAASLAPAVLADTGNATEAASADPFDTRALEGVLFADAHLEGGCGEDREKPAEEAEEAEGEGKCGEGEGKCGEGEGKCGEGEPDEDESAAPEEESDEEATEE